MFYVVWGRLEFRPQLFSTLFLALELYLLVSVHTGQRSWYWLWVFPPIYALVRPWVLTPAGIRSRQRGKIHYYVPYPLEPGFNGPD
jgi:hypothetical protein